MHRSNREVPGVLQYGVKSRAFWMRYQVLTFACCGAVLALAAVAVAPEIVARWQRFWWQQTWAACAVVPPFGQGTVVLEEGDVTAMPESVGVGRVLRRRGERSVAVMQEMPAEVRRVWRALGLDASMAEDPVIFAGRRRDLSGQEFLVVVQLHWRDDRSGFFNDEMPIWSIPAATPAHPRRYRTTAKNASNRMVNADGTFRVYAGELDPNDTTHFVIPYTVGNHRGVLDGWLRPTDGEWPPLLLQYRDGPGARSSLDTQGWTPELTPEPRQGSFSEAASRPLDRGTGGQLAR